MSDEQRDWLGRAKVDWQDSNVPRSRTHDDIYFSPEDGLAESRHTFLNGVGGPSLWAGAHHTVIAETGFGTGLNFLATWQAWRTSRKPGTRLTFISVEGYPLEPADLHRAHASWPELQALSACLVSALPLQIPGFHIIDLPDDLRLLLLYGDAGELLTQLDARVDAWYLDGFAPARNDDLWSDKVLAEIRRTSAPGARLATFTAAGKIRRRLSELGFEVTKASGFGRKRERIIARLPGSKPKAAMPRHPVILGDGIAGYLLRRSLRQQGIEAQIIAPGPDRMTGGSQNPVPLVTPRLTLDPDAYGRLQDQSFLRAIRLYDQLHSDRQDIWMPARGALAIAREAEDWERQQRHLSFAGWPEQLGQLLDNRKAGEISGQPLPHGGIWHPNAGALNRNALFDALGEDESIIRPESPVTIGGGRGDWSLEDSTGTLIRSDCLIIAAGPLSSDYLPSLQTVSTRVLGQVDYVRNKTSLPALVFGSYLSPSLTEDDGAFIAALGATFNREKAFSPGETAPLESETRDNFRLLDDRLPGHQLRASTLTPWAAWRLTTRDRLPFIGRYIDDRYALTGLGSRGFTYAPLLADIVAAMISGAPLPTRIDIARAMSPGRFGPLIKRQSADWL